MVGLRLLFLTQTYPRFDGDTAGPFIQELARGLARRGDRVTVLAPAAEGMPRQRQDAPGGPGAVSLETFRYAPARWQVLGYSRSLEKDEIPRLGALAVTPLYLAAAARAVRARLRRARREGDPYHLVHAHWVVPNGPPAAWGRRWGGGGVPLAVGLHGSDVFLAERPGVRTLVRRVLGGTALLTGCSPELVARVAALGVPGGPFPEERCRVIPYGVDTEVFAPSGEAGGEGGRAAAAWRDQLGIPPGAPVVLSVGRMATKKGYPVLLEVLPELLARHPEAHWVLAGGGDRLEEFRRRGATMAGGERVHFPGLVLRGTLPDLYRAADAFVLPAVHDPQGNVDGLPNVILEAMASGLAVVASGISGIPLAVVPEETGLLVPEQDPPALQAALDRLLAEPESRHRWGQAGRAKAVAELTWDVVAGRYRAGYEAVVPETHVQSHVL